MAPVERFFAGEPAVEAELEVEDGPGAEELVTVLKTVLRTVDTRIVKTFVVIVVVLVT